MCQQIIVKLQIWNIMEFLKCYCLLHNQITVHTFTATAKLCTHLPTATLCARLPTAMLCARLPTAMLCARLPTAMLCARLPTAMLCARLPTTMLCTHLPTATLCTHLISQLLYKSDEVTFQLYMTQTQLRQLQTGCFRKQSSISGTSKTCFARLQHPHQPSAHPNSYPTVMQM